MNATSSLDSQIVRMGFYSAILSFVSSIVLAVFGIAYHGLLLAFLTGSAEMAEIEGYLFITFMLLFPVIAALAVTLRGAMSSSP